MFRLQWAASELGYLHLHPRGSAGGLTAAGLAFNVAAFETISEPGVFENERHYALHLSKLGY